MPSSSERSLPFSFSVKDVVRIFYPFHPCYMLCPSYPRRFYQSELYR
jgi:hypothetical protein